MREHLGDRRPPEAVEVAVLGEGERPGQVDGDAPAAGRPLGSRRGGIEVPEVTEGRVDRGAEPRHSRWDQQEQRNPPPPLPAVLDEAAVG